MNVSEVLEKFYTFLSEEVAPKRELLDIDSNIIFDVFKTMSKFNVFGVFISEDYGGINLTELEQQKFIIEITKASGALALIQTQHQSIQRLIYTFASDKFKSHWLPPSCNGNVYFGIGFSVLNKEYKCPVIGLDCGNHYIVNGIIPYATGYGLFNWLALGFICDNEEIIALIPFTKQDGLIVGEVLPLIAGLSTQTITFKLDNYVVDKNNIIMKHKIGSHHHRTSHSKHFVSIHIGTMLALKNLIGLDSRVKSEPMIKKTYEIFNNKINSYWTKMNNHHIENLISPLRIEGLMIIQQLIFFAEQLFSGKSVIKSHPLNLLKREAHLFSTLGAEENMLRSSCDALAN